MTVIIAEILFILALTMLNGIFAMAEIAMVSSRKARLQQLAERGNRRARQALEIARAPESFLSAVQIGITLVGVLAGATGGATIAEHLEAALARVPAFAPAAETIAVGIIVVAITYVSLVLGELVPKRIALTNAERIAAMVAGPMRLLTRAAMPVVWLLSASSGFLLWLFRVRPGADAAVTQEEIRIMVRQGADAGTIRTDERAMIDRVFRLADRSAVAIMTPRTGVAMLSTGDTRAQIRAKVKGHGYALYPLCEGTPDSVIGVVRAQDVLAQVLDGNEPDLRAVARQPLFLPETVGSLKVLEEFRRTGKDTAVIVDEYGGLQGLVTATDLLRALMGDLFDQGGHGAELREDGSWTVDGMMPVDEFVEMFGLRDAAPVGRETVTTAGGMMVSLFHRIPAEGDFVERGAYRITVIGMDGQRVGRLRVVRRDPGGSGMTPAGRGRAKRA